MQYLPLRLKTGTGYIKERGNRAIGGLLGAAPGLALMGAGLRSTRGGMTASGGIGGIRSTRKTERGAGVQPMGVGKFLGRTLGSSVGGVVIPFVGSPVGDYVTSRKLQEYKKLKK